MRRREFVEMFGATFAGAAFLPRVAPSKDYLWRVGLELYSVRNAMKKDPERTLAAVRAFQTKYAADILKPLGLKSPTGSVYASTIKKINILACGGVPPSTQSIPVTSVATTSVNVVAPAMPAPKSGSSIKPKTPAAPKTPAKAQSANILNAIGGWFSKSRR